MKLKPTYRRNNDQQISLVPCANDDCPHGDEMIPIGAGTGVDVTYPAGGPGDTSGWLCADCAKVKV
jgi:hypothetical protein